MESSTSTPVRSGKDRRAATSSSIACSGDSQKKHGRRAGFILISVLWVVLFLAFAVASYTLTVRSALQGTNAAAAVAEAAALADAGTQLAIQDLVNARASRAWQPRFPPDGRARSCRIGDASITIVVADEAGRIDINTASEAMMRALLAGLGLPSDEAARLAAAVLDFRDDDDTRRPGGAEAEDYRQAGRPRGPRNGPFEATVEIGRVLGFDAPLVARILPFITVHSGLSGIDPAKASDTLIDLLAGRAGVPTPPQFATPGARAVRLPRELASVSSQRSFAILAQVTGPRGATTARETIVRLGTSRSVPHTVMAWGPVSAASHAALVDVGDC